MTQSFSSQEELLEAAESVKNMMLSRATGGGADPVEYQQLRGLLIADQRVKDRLPRCVRTCRTLDEFWGHIKSKFGTYAERREYLRQEFHPVLELLEGWSVTPGQNSASVALEKFDAAHVTAAWQKALERKSTDPEGAITAARTLVESVCKHILEEAGEKISDRSDMTDLYRQTAKLLNLSPSQHTEEVFRQILGGCQSVVGGLAALRNRLSDAHGKGKSSARPLPRHAELAVNLAGTMATYLVATWDTKEGRK